MSNALVWIAVSLSVIVFAEIISLVILHSKIAKLKSEKYSASKNKENGSRFMAVAGPAFMFGVPDISLIILSAILAAECVFLTIEVLHSLNELKGLLSVALPVAEPEPEPEPAPAPAPVVEEHVGPSKEEEELVAELVREVIEVEEAHVAITDEVAVHFVEDETVEKQKKYSKKSIVNIDTLSQSFETGDSVNLETLKEKGIVPQNADYVKVLARGVLDKHLIVEAQDFSVDAVKMIILTGGHAIKKS